LDGQAAEVAREVFVGEQGERIEVARIARPDLYFDHWHKSLSSAASRAFRDLLRETRPDVVHVHHWLRLSRDLVLVAAREGIPCVVSLHDAWASCPIVFRVRPDTQRACDAPVGPHPCIACAARVPPRTPWIPVESAYLMLAERQRDIGRELDLARARIAPSQAHAHALERTLGRAVNSLAVDVIAPLAGISAARVAAQSSSVDAVLAPAPASLRLVSWSQIARLKGTDLLLQAFLGAREELAGEVELELDVHGAAADAQFAAQLRALAGTAPVRWVGAFEARELASVIDPAAQVFVHAARAHESYGLSIDEAARLGLALLLPDAPVFRERCADVALFYAGGNAASLQEQLVRLARDPAQITRARQAATQWAARLASSASIALRHEEVYARAIAAGAPPAPAAGWFDERMSQQATFEWDRALSQSSAEALGLAPPPRSDP
jgi:glycosyltransferase involved in cell wall biosynthesis